jgi:hypothetical protein
MNKYNFEEYYPVIITAIKKRKNKWFKKISWISFEDIEMMIVHHLYKKWHLYNGNYPLINWINRVITNQFNNILRDHTKNAPLNNNIETKFSLHKNEEIDFPVTIRALTDYLAQQKNVLFQHIFELYFVNNKSEVETIHIINGRLKIKLTKKRFRETKIELHQTLKRLILDKNIDIFTG